MCSPRPTFHLAFGKGYGVLVQRYRCLMHSHACTPISLRPRQVGKGYGVLVQRCRYLEQSGCAAVCVNSCKVPTQEFFATKMGIPLTMTPNYEDFSCQ